MIYFNINIRNPAWWDRFKNIRSWSGSTPFEHKFWEAQIMKDGELLRIEFELTTRQDHAGARLELGLLGYKASFAIYDHRHWDYENNAWEKHE